MRIDDVFVLKKRGNLMSNTKYNTSNKSMGISFMELLALAFIVLKLTKVINWSWWIVLAPVWGQAILVLVIAIIVYSLKNKDII